MRIRRIKQAHDGAVSLDPTPDVRREYEYGNSDLNWVDGAQDTNRYQLIDPSGYSLSDPSMTDYLKGYNMQPYQFQQWARRRERNVLHRVGRDETMASIAKTYFGDERRVDRLLEMNPHLTGQSLREGLVLIVGRRRYRLAAKEVEEITYTPENLAREILTLWSQVDGPLQNFFDGFTMNKMSNAMIRRIAEILNDWGYNVVPTLTDQTPRYASLGRVSKVIARFARGNDGRSLLKYLAAVFPNSKTIRAVMGALRCRPRVKIATGDVRSLFDYYRRIFPDDYTTRLIDVTLNDSGIPRKKIEFQHFRDLQLTDQDLEQIERYDSETLSNPLVGPKDGGLGGYDFTGDMRSYELGGPPPNNYETGPLEQINGITFSRGAASKTRLLKKKRQPVG